MIAAFIGVDGAGKTGITRELKRKLASMSIPSDLIWCGFDDWRFLGFPLRRLRGMRLSANAKEMRLPGGSRFEHALENRFVRFIYCLAVSLDYVIQVTVKAGFSRENGRLVICDRYYMDQAISHSVQLESEWTLRFFNRLYSLVLPAPDIVFVVTVSPEVAFSRKTDIPSEDYVRRRLPKYASMASSYGYVTIDGESSIAKNVEIAANAIIESMANRG